MKQTHTEQSDHNLELSFLVLTDSVGGNSAGLAGQPELPRRVRPEANHGNCTRVRDGEEAVVKCLDSGMQWTWVQILVPRLVRFGRFLNLPELQFSSL